MTPPAAPATPRPLSPIPPDVPSETAVSPNTTTPTTTALFTTPPPQETAANPSWTPSPAPINKLGIHLLLDDGRNQWPPELWPMHLSYARQIVGEWGYVTELVRLDDLDAQRWQPFMDACADLNLTPVLRLATTFDQEAGWWRAPQPDADGRYQTVAAQYAAFIQALQWPTPAHLVIVGNEPNHGNEWSGRPDPAAYARFLMDVAHALRQADAGLRVLNAGLDPYTPNTNGLPFLDGMVYLDEETFLDEMFAAGPEVFSVIDVWASHAYPMGPLTEGPWQQTFEIDLLNGAANPQHLPPLPGLVNRGINGYEWELFKLASFGLRPLPVLITETGWRHAETTDPAATDNGHPLPDAETVAVYLDLALWGNNGRYPHLPETGWTPWLSDPRVMGVTPFALNGAPAEWGHTNWLALDAAGNVLDTYPQFDLLATRPAQP